MVELRWDPSISADDVHPDEETDDVPEPGSWAYVSLLDFLPGETEPQWKWAVLDRWDWDDANVIAEGYEATKEAAKGAVQRWSDSQV